METKSVSAGKQFIGRSSCLLPYLQDESITDILINGTTSLFIETDGKLEQKPSPFSSDSLLFELMERLLLTAGKRIDATRPYTDGRLADGSRFHIILPPIAIGGPFISIRKWRSFEHCELASFGPTEIVGWLSQQARNKKNILISGGTGSGKTTLLSRLLDCVPEFERIALLEETTEIRARHRHLIQLEARPPSPEGIGEVTLRMLIKNVLRMRPDRIVVGECRGAEAFDMLQAMNCGHGGSLSTIHANSSVDALRRLEALAMLAAASVNARTMREWISTAIGVVVQLTKQDGNRRIAEVITVGGMEGEMIRILPIYPTGSLHTRITPVMLGV
ncbi:MAG: CpaF family protein [Deltaproteobacteria bacterium]|nr:CpaF family protein [Deltaproteobacteria bacterium]